MAKKASKSKPKPTKKRSSFKLSKQNKIILGSLLMLFSIALFFSFISFYFNWQDDQSLLSEFKDRNELAKNLLNKFGASISHFFMYKGFGVASLIFPFLICISGIYLFLGLPSKALIKKWIWGLLFVIWISIALGFFATTSPLLGGLVGFEMNDFLQDYAGKIGVLLLLVFGLIFILVRLFDVTPEGISSFFKSRKEAITTEFKANQERKANKKKSLEEEEELLTTSLEEEAPVVVDTYTHKTEIPHLEKEEDSLSDFEITAPEPEETLAMEVEQVIEEPEEIDVLGQ